MFPNRRSVRTHRLFSYSVVVGFVAFTLLGFGWEWRVYRGLKEKHPAHFVSNFRVAGRPAELFHEEVTRDQAKRFGFHWVNQLARVVSNGVAYDLRHDPELLAEAYPGYPPALRTDEALWRRYFSREFDHDLWLPSLIDERQLFVHVPWLGCVDIFEKYGADVVVFGNSETYLGLVPALLGRPGERVLFCARGGLGPRALLRTLELLGSRAGGKKVPTVILGFAQNWVDRGTFDPGELDARGQERALDDFAASQNPVARFLALNGESFFRVPGWEKFSPLNYKLVGQLAERADGQRENASAAVRTVFESFGIFFDDRKLGQLPSIVADAQAWYRSNRRPAAGDCAVPEVARKTFASTMRALESFAEKVYVYRTPVSPLEREKMEPCLHRAIDEMLNAQRSERTAVRTGSSGDYGLSWPDYVKPTVVAHVAWLDLNHTNYGGAAKVTREIRRWIDRGEGRE